MKRIVTLLLAAGLVFGAFGGAHAADIKAKGAFETGFEWNDNKNFQNGEHDGKSEDDFSAASRLRTQIDVIASESLSGTVYFEIGGQKWGSKDGALGADGKVVEVKRSYIDWTVPQTDLKVRMGIQGLALPGHDFGSPVLDDDVAALTLSYAFNDMVGVTAFWARPYDMGGDDVAPIKNAKDEMDLAGLIVPVSLDGVKVTPWVMYGSIGKDVLNAVQDNRDDLGDIAYNSDSTGHAYQGLSTLAMANPAAVATDSMTAWWGGAAFELTMFDPFKFQADVNYGRTSSDDEALERNGWLASAKASYKLGMVTPALYAWYGTGEDDDINNGSERMPSIAPSWLASSYGYANSYGVVASDTILGDNGAGTWAIGIEFGDISFIENLSHVFRVHYVKGTNDADVIKDGKIKGTAFDPSSLYTYGGQFLTNEDSAIEVNFDHTYNIYENLALVVEMGWIKLDLDEEVWADKETDDAWKLNFQFKYSF